MTGPSSAVPRRTVLAGTGAVVAVAALAACSSGSAGPRAASAPSTGTTPLARVADVPVGGAVAAKDAGGDPVLVAQPAAGTVVAFSAVCTHRGCTVAPAGRTFACPCHGSVYDAATGKVLHGPAPRALTPVPVHVAGGDVLPGPA